MSLKDQITEVLSRVPEVKWDRLVDAEKTRVYGWLEREDDHADFVLIDFWLEAGQLTWEVLTSCPSPPERFWERLEINVEDHADCRRVEHAFPRVLSAIREGA